MKKIRLKDEYPWLSGDEYIEISDEIAEVFAESTKEERRYKRNKYNHRAFYSLDVDDGIEAEMLFVSLSPQEIYERKVTQGEIYAAINSLPEKQAKRIYAHFFQDMSMTQIGRIEGVSKMAVSKSIESGLKKIEKLLKNGFTKD